jgi:hypothetical protein
MKLIIPGVGLKDKPLLIVIYDAGLIAIAVWSIPQKPSLAMLWMEIKMALGWCALFALAAVIEVTIEHWLANRKKRP